MLARSLIWLSLILVTILITLPCRTPVEAAPIARREFVPETDPQREAESAIRFLESVSNDDRLYIRLVSDYAVPDSEVWEFSQLSKIWWRQLTLDPNRKVVPALVPGTKTLWWFDLRSFGWNRSAWRVVAQRDKTFREPWISHDVAERIRLLIGEKQPKNFHVIGLVDMWALYRRTYQTLETPDYYDLLFAQKRFVATEETEPIERLVLHDGLWKTEVYQSIKAKFVDFPQNEKEWLSALLGSIKEDDYEKAIKDLRARRGAVCKGSEDVKTGGSFVARNNRIAWVAPALTRIGAVYAETFDVVKTAGKRDLEENAFTDQDRDKGRVFRDGGELLFSLPAGDGIAALVINGEGKRVEVVPGNIAIHTRDPRDRTVRNGAMACLACHADAYCWIPLKNVLEGRTPEEVDINFQDKKYRKDRKAAEDFDAFFLGWQDDLTGLRSSTQAYWQQSTGTRTRGYKDGLNGTQIGSRSLKFKWMYDDPLDIDQMVRETGVPESILRVAASRSVLSRSIDAARKSEVARPAWDEDVFPDLMTQMASRKEKLPGTAVPLKRIDK